MIDVVKVRQEDGKAHRVYTTTDPHLVQALSDIHEITAEDLFEEHILKVDDNIANTKLIFASYEEYESWITGLERAAAWVPTKGKMSMRKEANAYVEKDEIQKNVNPNHYRGLLEGMPDLGWLDIESRRPLFREPAKFIAAVDLQESKYMMRLGQKDNELQERKKSLFYKAYCILYIENGGKPIKADLVHEWMSKMPKMPGECM